MSHRSVFAAFIFAAVFAASSSQAADAKKPNIIVVLCDDLGFGDVRCLNPEGKIATPNFDRLASEGIAFTDAHSGSSVCTPTRYGVLTGRYAWRTKLQAFVLGGLSPRLIEPGAKRWPRCSSRRATTRPVSANGIWG
ncbi:MAG: sulfatase-like hydrolase/transferase [Pirellulales bacterium]